MSTLDSSSTIAAIKAAYLDNASYSEDDSASKARAFVTACRMLLLKLPKRAGFGDRHELEIDLEQIRDEMRAAQQWLAGHADEAVGGGVTFADFSADDYRD